MECFAYLYRYATISFIGGGFGAGIHNILEAAVYGKPMLFGPNYHKFQEAIDLIDHKAAFSANQKEIIRFIPQLINSKEHYKEASLAALRYIENNSGATEVIFKHLFSQIE